MTSPLTVRDALDLPALAEATLVAGTGGLDNIIRWVHIVDIPDATYEWAEGGELLLTAGFGLVDNSERRKQIIPTLAKKNLAGMVLSTGHYLAQTPGVMCEAANRLDFPIIELPPDVPFINVTEAIFSQIVNQQYALQQRAEEIQHTLTQLVLDGGSMQQVAGALAELLERSVTVESAAFEVLAAARAGPVDEARTRSVAEGRTTPDLAEKLLKRGIYDRLLEERRPLHVPPMPELAMTMERIVAPIIIAHEIIGYMWIIAGEHPLDDLDELALQHAATVAGLLMLKEQAVQEAELTLRGDLLDQLIHMEEHPIPALVEQAHRLDFHLDRAYQVLMIKGRPAAGGARPTLWRRVEDWLKAHDIPALIAPRNAHVIVILQMQQTPDGEAVARQLLADLDHPAELVLISVGRPVDDLSGLKDSYEQANEALQVAVSKGHKEGVFSFEALGVNHWLYHLPDNVLHANRYLKQIERLAQADRTNNVSLLPTLEAYLVAGGTVTQAAESLNIHRNTLTYRLERIEDMLGVDLGDPDLRLNLYIALKAYRLRGPDSG